MKKIGKPILVTEFGSSLYGTRLPTSDQDFKGIFIPRLEDLLLQKSVRTSYQENTKLDKKAKNTNEDQDMEWVTLHAFIRLCSEGQNLALDLLFTPPELWKSHDPLWTSLLKERPKLLCRKIQAIVGYTKQQAAKYGIKGSRLAAVRHVLEVLKKYPKEAKLNEVDQDKFQAELSGHSQIAFVYCRGPGSLEEKHLEVCNRKVPMHARFKYAVEVFQKIYDEYGHRARQAEINEGLDWKALMHAIRVAEQAKELLKTGFITFPRPEKDLLIEIRKGNLPFDQVAQMIENGLEEIEALSQTSTLPEEIDKEYWDSWLVQVYGEYVCSEMSLKKLPKSQIR